MTKKRGNQRGFIHTLSIVILLLGLAASVYLVQQKLPQIFKPKAAPSSEDTINTLTQELISENQKSKSLQIQNIEAAQNSLAQMLVKAKNREDLLSELLKKDADSFLKHAVLASISQDFPKEVQQYLEKEESFAGELQSIHYDNFKDKKSTFNYYLNQNNEKTEIHFVNDPQKIVKTPAEGFGVKLKSNFVVASTLTQDRYHLTIQGAPQPTTGTQKVAYLLVKFANDPKEPITSEELRKIVDTNLDSTKNYYKEVSFNQLNLNKDIYGYYTISKKGDSCEIFDWMSQTDNLAQSDFNLQNYDHLVYVVTGENNCPFGGTAMGGTPLRDLVVNFQSVSVYTHELGHNIGLGHANHLDCAGKQIDDPFNCEKWEYGDPYDVMGWGHNHLNAPHKILLNWLQTGNIKTIADGQTGIYTITDPWEQKTNGISVLKISVPGYQGNYFLEYRKPIGFDQNIPPSISEGALLHFSYDDPNRSAYSYLINIHLGKAAFADQATFTDPYNGLTIKQLSHTANSVTLEVRFGPKTPNPIYEPYQPGLTSMLLAQPKNSYKVGEEIRVPIFVRSDNYYGYEFSAAIRYPTENLEVKGVNLTYNSFITRWDKPNINPSKGIITVKGSVLRPGIRTKISEPDLLMAEMVFAAKKKGFIRLAPDELGSYIGLSCPRTCNFIFNTFDTFFEIKEELPPPSPKPYKGYCIQQLTWACDVSDPERCYEFSDPCSVPDGWIEQPRPIPTPTSVPIPSASPYITPPCAYVCSGGGYCGTGGNQPGSFPADCNITCSKTWIYNAAGDSSCPSSHNYCWICPE